MDEKLIVFGREMTTNELLSMVGWATRHRYRRMALFVQQAYGMTLEDLVNEIVVLILKQSQNPKWLKSPPSRPSTAVMNCAFWTLLNLQRRPPLDVVDENDGVVRSLIQTEIETDPASEDIVEQITTMLPRRLAYVLLSLYGDPCGVMTLSALSRRMGLSRERVRQLEQQGLQILRSQTNKLRITG